jgi:hypothetical protein
MIWALGLLDKNTFNCSSINGLKLSSTEIRIKPSLGVSMALSALFLQAVIVKNARQIRPREEVLIRIL